MIVSRNFNRKYYLNLLILLCELILKYGETTTIFKTIIQKMFTWIKASNQES